MKLKKILVAALSAMLLGAILTHYLERFEDPFVVIIRDTIMKSSQWESSKKALYNSTDKIKVVEGTSIGVMHPVKMALSIYDDVYCTLARHLTEPPITVLEQAIIPTDSWCRDRRINKEKILKIANAFIQSGEKVSVGDIEALMLPYKFPNTAYGINAPWYSGMAQGMAGEVLLAAYFISGDRQYFDALFKVANGLRLPIESGGTLVKIDHGVWFEEYASPQVTGHSPLVLNGHMFAMDLLYWLKQIKPTQWSNLYEAGHAAVEARISNYLAPGWSYYDAQQNFANSRYHRLHIRQLNRLARVGLPATNIISAIRSMQYDTIFPFGIFSRLLLQHNTALMLIWGWNSMMAFAGLAWFEHYRIQKKAL